jgi:hypothetical protein
VGIGYRSVLAAAHLTLAELAGHGLLVGGPKSGKTTLLRLLIEALCGRLPIVVIDPKGSDALAATVRALGGQVWTLDGKLPADLLDPRPWQVPDLLLEAEDYSVEARVFRDAAHQRALWAAWSLALDGKPMGLAELRRRLDRDVLARCLERHRDRDPRIAEWLHRLEHQPPGGLDDSGAHDLDRAIGILLDGPALRGSLRTCPEALRLEDVIDTRGLVLFSLSEREYPQATRKVAAWVLLAMGRLAHQLPPGDDPQGPRALLLVDEVGAIGSASRHLRPLVGRAREAGLAVVLATQGLSDLEAVDRALVHQVLQDTAWQIGFRQGSPRDAELLQALFGQEWVEDVSWRSDGLLTTRRVQRPRVPVDEWMNGLHPGDAWLRRAPIDRGWGQDRIRVAQPRPVRLPPPRIPAVSRQPRLPRAGTHHDLVHPTRRPAAGGSGAGSREGDRTTVNAAPPAEAQERAPSAAAPTAEQATTRPGPTQQRQECGPARPATPRGTEAQAAPAASPRFDVALFASIDRPTVQPRTLSLDELVGMLGRFEVLADKRRGRCWSPTKYADGASSRRNAGVAAVSCLVFDCGRVPPDPNRLAGVCWIGHTTHSHTSEAPRWRVVIPLARPVPAKRWADVWRRARVSLCPEADPQCKDPSRQYYLPSRPAGVASDNSYHPGPLLDPASLPELPPENRQDELSRAPSARRPRKTTASDRGRGGAYLEKVIAELEEVPPGGRNAALNHAAWTLGRWIAAGALEQAEVEDALYVAALTNGLVRDDGARQTWATIRSGLSAGLQQPIDLDADRRPPAQKRRRGRGESGK